MVGIVIASHGNFASGLLDAATLIIGEQTNVFTIGLKHGDDVAEFGEALSAGVAKVDEGNGVLVLTDLFGASPYNQAVMLSRRMEKLNYQLLTGVNLPMLLQALNDRMLDKDLEEMKANSKSAGQDGIVDFFAKLNKAK
ncbi:PTS system, IIA component, mannose/fructose/sorbose family [Lactiplantibacillus pentosus KCA1]|nr:PTS sugar transporter subunit IIA [Lactiplantibacillus pentosus]EIW12565.1 PTS system, IIA component, mannose/fructose/sorbose family [Lactiplantibacillus pentosus KCA1]